MKLKVNGDNIEVTDGLTVTALLKERNVKMPEMVSVELNGSIVRRAAFAETVLNDGDEVEFLYFMGGGSESY